MYENKENKGLDREPSINDAHKFCLFEPPPSLFTFVMNTKRLCPICMTSFKKVPLLSHISTFAGSIGPHQNLKARMTCQISTSAEILSSKSTRKMMTSHPPVKTELEMDDVATLSSSLPVLNRRV